jgi:hypothetical protein
VCTAPGVKCERGGCVCADFTHALPNRCSIKAKAFSLGSKCSAANFTSVLLQFIESSLLIEIDINDPLVDKYGGNCLYSLFIICTSLKLKEVNF